MQTKRSAKKSFWSLSHLKSLIQRCLWETEPRNEVHASLLKRLHLRGRVEKWWWNPSHKQKWLHSANKLVAHEPMRSRSSDNRPSKPRHLIKLTNELGAFRLWNSDQESTWKVYKKRTTTSASTLTIVARHALLTPWDQASPPQPAATVVWAVQVACKTNVQIANAPFLNRHDQTKCSSLQAHIVLYNLELPLSLSQLTIRWRIK